MRFVTTPPIHWVRLQWSGQRGFEHFFVKRFMYDALHLSEIPQIGLYPIQKKVLLELRFTTHIGHRLNKLVEH